MSEHNRGIKGLISDDDKRLIMALLDERDLLKKRLSEETRDWQRQAWEWQSRRDALLKQIRALTIPAIAAKFEVGISQVKTIYNSVTGNNL